MSRLYLSELKRCCDSVLCRIAFVVLMAANMLSYVYCTQNDFGKSYQFIRSADENFVLQATEAAFIPYILLIFFPITSTVVWSLSMRREIQNKSALLIMQRVDIRRYIRSKALAVFIITFCVGMIPLLVNLLFCHLTYPANGFDSAWAEPDYLIGYFSYNEAAFLDMVRLQHPTLYNMVYIFNYGLFSAGLALLGLGIGFLARMEHYYYVKIPVTMFLVYTVQNIIFAFLGLGRFTLQAYLSPGQTGSLSGYFVTLFVLYMAGFVFIHRGIRRFEML